MEQNLLLERLERLERENLKFRRSARFMKLLVPCLIAITVAGISIPIAHSITLPGPVIASEFDLLGPGLRVTARLQTLRNGPNLTFYDNSGKIVADVGWVNDSTSAQAGLSVFDGNSVLAGNGVVRAGVGYTARSAAGTGVGFISYDGTGDIRTNIGQTLNGSAAYEQLYDDTGSLRTGIDVNSANVGFFAQDANGIGRAVLGEVPSDSSAAMTLLNAAGGVAADGTVDAAGADPHFAVVNSSGTIIATLPE